MKQRRICWPDPDATCLEGGCGYCNDHPFRSISSIQDYAVTVVNVRNRGDLKIVSALQAFTTGYRAGFYNAQTK